MGGLDAGIAAMRRAAKAVAQLSRVPSQASATAAPKIAALINAEFDSEADPYGHAWAPHAEGTIKRWGEHNILILTDVMREGIRVEPTSGAGIAITIDAPYAAFHQVGTVNMPARPVLPSYGLPARWKRAIEESVNAAALEGWPS
jgi:phage gpG-like protein